MLRVNPNRLALTAALIALLPHGNAFGQRLSLPTYNLDPALKSWTCKISGRVITPHQDPVSGAEVRIRLERTKRPLLVETGLQGDFQASFPAASGSRRIEIVIGASKPGYAEAQDMIEVERDREQAPLELVLRRERSDPQLLDWDSLLTVLVPRLRTPVADSVLTGSQLRHFELGVRMLDEDNMIDAAPLFRSAARHSAGCIECLTLSALAGLDSGAWSRAAAELSQAARLAALGEGKARRMEPFIALGVLQTWRGELAKAQISLLQALALKPDDPLALCELGRAFLLQGKMAPADRYLERALAHGANRDAHLLRAQALSELGQTQEAQKQIDAFLDGRKPRQLPEVSRALYAQISQRIELESGSAGSSLLERSPSELVKAVPDLKGLEPDADQSDLDPILEKIAEGVRSLFQRLPNTSSHEVIEMERLRADGKRVAALDQDFEYLAVNANKETGLELTEYRTDKAGNMANPRNDDGTFMVTKGFAADPLIFFPDWLEGSRFRLIGRQQTGSRETIVIAFAERPAKAKMLEEFRMKGRSAVVLVQGLAWVDAETYRVLRMRTELLKPAPEIKLDGQTTDVRFAEVRFPDADQPFWLPRDVSVLVRWNGRIYHNQHHYSDYAVFEVSTRQHIKTPKHSAPAGK